MNLNSVAITGRLTADPELRSSSDGTAFATFSLAINRPPRGGQDQSPVYIDVIAFGGQAEAIAEHVKRGRKVGVQGRLDVDQWTDQEDRPRSKHKIVASDVEFLEAPRSSAPSAEHASA